MNCALQEVFKTNTLRGRHENEVHGIPMPFYCDQCGIGFLTSNFLASHVKRKHTENKEKFEYQSIQFELLQCISLFQMQILQPRLQGALAGKEARQGQAQRGVCGRRGSGGKSRRQ
jgi:hypothetical protein